MRVLILAAVLCALAHVDSGGDRLASSRGIRNWMTQRTISEGVSGGFPGQLRGIERVGQVAFSETAVKGEPLRDATKLRASS